MSSMRLFPDEMDAIKPAEGRNEPTVWIRRLRLVESLSPDAKMLRDIEFRRGLNIICTEKARPEDRSVVGHSVGTSWKRRVTGHTPVAARWLPEFV